jgi:hypothetical protein
MYTTSNGFQMKMLTVIPFGNKRLEMFTVQYLWKQKTRSALGIYHENFHKFLSFVTRGFIIISSIPKWYASAEKMKLFRNT